jgi:DNA-directed RNA polymerase specialized sigma24 family protein
MERNVAELEKLYRNGFAKFVSVLGSVAGSREAGRDATQEAFARALAGFGRFSGRGVVGGMGVADCLANGTREMQPVGE